MNEAFSSTEESESSLTRNEIVLALSKASRTDCGTRGLNKNDFNEGSHDGESQDMCSRYRPLKTESN